MEQVVFPDSPLATYLQGEGEDEREWSSFKQTDRSDDTPPPSPDAVSFAPRGIPKVQSKFRQQLPPRLRLDTPTKNNALSAISSAMNSRLGRTDNAKFLERFRYIIVASQLLNDQSYPDHSLYRQSSQQAQIGNAPPQLPGALSVTGAAATAAVSFALVWVLSWARGENASKVYRGRIASVFVVFAKIAVATYIYLRKQRLRYLRQQILTEGNAFVAVSNEFDAASTASMSLIQEVELVSRGYRLSTPMPPITRLEGQSQNKRCLRLRRNLRRSFNEVIPRYTQACNLLKPLAEEIPLEKYYDVYDLSASDLQELEVGLEESSAFDDPESLRCLKLLAARFHTIRKVLLCCLLALDADGGKPDFFRWGTAVDEIQALVSATKVANERLRQILSEEESFPTPPTPKIPLTPARERWRSQLRQLGSLSTGIRGLSAKMHVLREESDKVLSTSTDESTIQELGASLMQQYDSIGGDLTLLMQTWEDGRTALASNIDRNHRRISSISGSISGALASPLSSPGALVPVDEGSPSDALKALNGEPRTSASSSSLDGLSIEEEVYEAVALPKQRPKSMMSREERIRLMKEDRAKREEGRKDKDASTNMLRELESVINLRPRGKTSPAERADWAGKRKSLDLKS